MKTLSKLVVLSLTFDVTICVTVCMMLRRIRAKGFREAFTVE